MADIMLRPKEVVCKWVDAFNNHDVEEITMLLQKQQMENFIFPVPHVGLLRENQFPQDWKNTCLQKNLQQQI